MRNRKVYGIGETVYDIIFKDGKPVTGHPGGSTFNCMISLGRCGVDSAFISETGNDKVGDLIIKFLEANNLSSKYVNQFEDGKSALSLAFLDENNDAVYNFYKDYPKQRLELELPKLEKDDILVYGSFFALNEKVRKVVKHLLEQAYKAQAILYYDPNYRSTHLANRENLIPTLEENFRLSTIIRASDEDFGHIYPGLSIDEVYEEVASFCPNLICTANKNDVSVFAENFKSQHKVPKISPVSTVGAGDSFNAGFVYALIANKIGYDDLINNLTKETWMKLVDMAISFSSEVCMNYENYVSFDFAKKLKLV